MFCLNTNLTNTFLKKLKSGEIDPKKLSDMSSNERRDFFSSFLGEANAREVNSLFESKLLLKDQQQGLISWAKQVSGIKPEVKRDIISRVEKMTEILNPSTEKAFLADLASHKLETTVTMAEASHISELAKVTSENKLKIDPSSPIQSPDRMAYGRALVKFGDYISDLKNRTRKLTLEDLKVNPLGTIGKAISNFAGMDKALKATLDNSAILRQGLKVLFTHPGIWMKDAAQSFVDIAKVFGGKDMMSEVKADILSRPNAMNGLYQKENLAIGVVEEAFPSSFPEKIPGFGRIFKASETAFTAFQYRTRADVFDKYVEIANKSGGDITGVGRLVNSLTGRGTFGKRLESAASIVNNLLFSPRFLKSNFDILTGQMSDYKYMNSFARKEAAINSIKVISGIAAVLTIADNIWPGSVEKDPRSADFGKIRIGDTRFDVSGGISGLVTLAARLATGSSKSSTTGKVNKLNTGKFGALTGQDVITNFFTNKLSPAASVIKDILNGEDFQHNKLGPNLDSVMNELNNLLTPLPITTYLELKNNPNSANIIIAMIADELGVSTNTYSKQKRFT